MNIPAGSSAQYQVKVRVCSSNTACETAWKACNVAFWDYAHNTTYLTLSIILKVTTIHLKFASHLHTKYSFYNQDILSGIFVMEK